MASKIKDIVSLTKGKECTFFVDKRHVNKKTPKVLDVPTCMILKNETNMNYFLDAFYILNYRYSRGMASKVKDIVSLTKGKECTSVMPKRYIYE